MTPEQEIWHELVLCGIGGATIAQAQRNISLPEFHAWCKYRAKYGTLDTRRKMERTAALVAFVTACGFPRKAGARAPRYEDFLPQRESAEKPLSLEQAMAKLR